MIPQHLTLTNFLSYQNVSLDFRSLHTACICGSNGAGKSSLLEAITWVIWGKCRAEREDDILHNGTNHGRVDFQFISNHQVYKIIRSRQRGKSSVLEFQIKSGESFRTLSAKGLRATQDAIVAAIKLDYDTFTNSAYLRQGRADEFMLRRPNERKQILADLLKLDQYEILAVRAKDIAKEAKGKAEILDNRLQLLRQEVDQRPEIENHQTQLINKIAQIQADQQQEEWQLQQLQVSQNQRRTWQTQVDWQRNQCQSLTLEIDRLQHQIIETEQQQATLQEILDQEIQINQGFAHYQALQKQEQDFSVSLKQHQELKLQLQTLKQELIQAENELKRDTEQQVLRLEYLDQQIAELQPILQQEAEIQGGLVKLQTAREKLQALDQLQHRISPLLKRQYELQSELEKAAAHRQAQLEQKQEIAQQLQQQIAAIPALRQSFRALDQEISQLKNKQVYLKRVEEKGQERRHFQERLQENQRLFEKQLGEAEQKLALLETPEAVCPLCEQGLEGHHRDQVLAKSQNQCQELRDHIWIIKEQLTLTGQELQILRTEYQTINQQLSNFDRLQQKSGQLEAELEQSGEKHEQLRELVAEIEQLQTSLDQKTFAQALQIELHLLMAELAQCQYDEQTHALARADVDQLRKIEIRYAKLKEAKTKLDRLNGDRPGLQQQIQALQNQLTTFAQTSPLSQHIQQIQSQIDNLGYDGDRHQALLTELREQQVWQLRQQELQRAKNQLPTLINRLEDYQNLIGDRRQALLARQGELAKLEDQVTHYADHELQIQQLESTVQQRRQQLDQLLAQKGGIEQRLIHLDNLHIEYRETQQQFQGVKKQFRVHEELGRAFGKNGIQAMMIENILPQLEAETNYILARLTGNQHHIQFVTQREGKSSTKRKPKMIDTLDILIADAQGTRPYETYSGGEAFRINFSIRLALAKLLAQRSGTALQLLIIDEGFGTQDADGCDRLVAAITAIASDFACILTVTHMPQFKEAFQQRIEVYKTNDGSQLSIIS
ncbi:MAG: exonuclease subunit SbcC [Synechocystis sp.]|nr:exonuclease subunit SbcC [Synechocystis sp.]